MHYHHHPEWRWLIHLDEVLLLKVAVRGMDQTSAQGESPLCTQRVHHQ